MRASIELAEQGVEVLAVGKRPRADVHTSLAAGGINAALATMDPEDSWQQHAADTLKESYLLANPVTVQIVTEGGLKKASSNMDRPRAMALANGASSNFLGSFNRFSAFALG